MRHKISLLLITGVLSLLFPPIIIAAPEANISPQLEQNTTQITAPTFEMEQEFQKLKQEIEGQQKDLKTEVEYFNTKAEMTLDNSTFILGKMSLFAAIFGVIISGFGIIIMIRTNKTDKDAKELIAKVEQEARNALYKLNTISAQSNDTIKETRIEAQNQLGKVEREITTLTEETNCSIKELLEKTKNDCADLVQKTETEIHKLMKCVNENANEAVEVFKNISKKTQNRTDLSEKFYPTDSISQSPELIQAVKNVTEQPDASAYLRAQAFQASTNKNWQRSLELWEIILEEKPKDFSALLYAASCSFKILHEVSFPAKSPLWDKTRGYYEKAIKIEEFNTLALNNLGLLYQFQAGSEEDKNQELWGKAEKYFKMAIAIDSKYMTAQFNLGALFYAQAKFEQNPEHKHNLCAKAIKYFDDATKIDLDDPDNAHAWYSCSQLFTMQSEHATGNEKTILVDKATEYYEKAKKHNPDQVEILDERYKDGMI